MKNIFSNSKGAQIILAFLLIIFFINFNYSNHIYRSFKETIINEKRELASLSRSINKFSYTFNKNMTILNKIKFLENKIMENKYEIGYLKSKNKTRRDIINVFKDIVLRSNVNLDKIELISEKSKKETGEILFNFKGSATLESFILLLDMIDNKQEFLSIDTYTLQDTQNQMNTFNIDMTLKFVYLNS